MARPGTKQELTSRSDADLQAQTEQKQAEQRLALAVPEQLAAAGVRVIIRRTGSGLPVLPTPVVRFQEGRLYRGFVVK